MANPQTKITKTGKSVIANRLNGKSSEPVFTAWGLSNAVEALEAKETDVGLFQESQTEARGTGAGSLTTTTTTNDTYKVVGTQTAESAEKKVTEAGLYDSATKAFQAKVLTGSKIIGSSTETEVKIETGNYTPENKTYIQIRSEVLKVEAGTGTNVITVKRAENGSSAISTIAAGDALTVGAIPGPYKFTTENPTAGTILFSHASFATVALQPADSIQWTWEIQFT